MNNLFISSVIGSLALVSLAAPALAQNAQPVQLAGEVKLERTVTGPDGTPKIERVAPEVIVPGDRLIFSTAYRNAGVEPVENFVVRNALPGPVRLADDADAALVVSVDGGKSWGLLKELQVAGEDGTSRPAQAADVTHVRWTLALVKPGEGGRIEYPAIIR